MNYDMRRSPVTGLFEFVKNLKPTREERLEVLLRKEFKISCAMCWAIGTCHCTDNDLEVFVRNAY